MVHIVPKTAAAALCSALALTACTPVDRAETDAQDPALANLDTSRACFFTREINGFSNAPNGPHGRDRLYVSTGVREQWLLETRGACPELDFSMQVGFDTRGRTSMCTGDLETLVVPDRVRGTVDRCPVEVLGRVIEQDDEAED
ncbi:DUF6491 family protein [Aurantiacibacter gilvus]|uniref:DUF6491 family protein n=1 Tax=Aurantiacibacter gilvus TaxID=3139141 RepID=A0ABU9IFN8_9SPHN